MKKITKNIIFLIIIFGVIIRAIYIIKTPVTERQHDVYTINDQGHLGYIYTIYETGKLPTTNSIQFYHPPLHHLISAGWLRLETAIGIDLNSAIEGLQILTAIYSSLILLVVYFIVCKIRVKDIYKILIMIVMAFHPTFIILAGSINNDILTVLLMFVIILYLLKWYEKTNLLNTIILALTTGLCVMTKVSGAIMAIPIIGVFVYKIIEIIKEDKHKLKNIFGLFILFGLISLPIGLWYPIRNKILFNQPIGGVLLPSGNLYIGDYNYWQRFGLAELNEFRTTFCVIPGDHNVLAYIIKTSIFGEYFYNVGILADTIKGLNIVIIAISIIAMIWKIFDKSKENKLLNMILSLTYIIHIISYIFFNIEYPYTCTMDFRYIVPTIFVGIYFIAQLLDKLSENKKFIILSEIIEYLIVIFCILSMSMFLII